MQNDPDIKININTPTSTNRGTTVRVQNSQNSRRRNPQRNQQRDRHRSNMNARETDFQYVTLFPIYNTYEAYDTYNSYSTDPQLLTILNNSLNSNELVRNPNVEVKINTDTYYSTQYSCDSCTICRDSFTDGTKISELNCEHIFHPECISEWMKYKQVCPVCRSNVD